MSFTLTALSSESRSSFSIHICRLIHERKFILVLLLLFLVSAYIFVISIVLLTILPENSSLIALNARVTSGSVVTRKQNRVRTDMHHTLKSLM